MKKAEKPLDKFAIATALEQIGVLLELKGGQYFKARAYKRGARAVAELTEDVGKLIEENRLTFVSGIGEALAKEIRELYTTGESRFLNQLRAALPEGIIELSRIPDLSVQKIERLQESLGISSVEELKAACEAGKIRKVKGFGAKSEQKILNAIVGYENREHFIHLHHATADGHPAPASGSSTTTTNNAPDDATIQSAIEKRLTNDSNLSSLGITAGVSNGKVTLTGTVKSEALKAQVERVVRSVKGVKSIDNQIRVG